MADKNTPNRAANMEKVEGDRWKSEEDAVPSSPPESPRYRKDDGDRAVGITNRPLDEEIENQQALPERGSTQDDERRRTEDVER